MGVNAAACMRVPLKGPKTETEPWTVYLGAPSRAPAADAALPAGDSLAWRTGVGKEPAGPLALGAMVLAVQTVHRDVLLLSRESGAVVWKRRLNGASATGPLIGAERVYAASAAHDGRVYALSLVSGHSEWERGLGSVTGPIALTDGAVVAAVESGAVTALDAGTGRVRWDRQLDGPVRGGVAAVGNTIFVATDDSLYLLSTADGGSVVSVGAPGALLAPPAVTADALILGSADGVLAAFTRDSLRPLWTVRVGAPVAGSPAVARDTVFTVTHAGVLWCVPLADPATRDSSATGLAALAGPSPIREGVLMASVTGRVAVATCDGGVRTVREVPGPVLFPPVVDRGALFIADGDGRVSEWR